ncbi:hypothetical protein PAL_GLEAN10004921 [Pteropus alecto]|uniref:Uncharacterized protein n=1 Tax=Pteropus alecto TaxID=9402 RepID=L5KMS7_PTEAL|nr:hypothetical protein PAL_GLEAN10004921 [Pteropus alecto]
MVFQFYHPFFIVVYFFLMPTTYFCPFLLMNILQYCYFKLMVINFLTSGLSQFLDGVLQFVEFAEIRAVCSWLCGSLSKMPPTADFGLKPWNFIGQSVYFLS